MSRRIVVAGLVGMTMLLANVAVANAFSGRRLISAAGAVRESGPSESGTLSLSGMIDFNKSGGASAVQITIDMIDSGGDNIACVLTTPGDVAYTLSKEGIGMLTLTVGAGDTTCTAGNTGKSIVFNFVTLTTTGRITATSIDLVDSMSDVVDSTTATGSVLAQ